MPRKLPVQMEEFKLNADSARAISQKRWNTPEARNKRAEKHIEALVAIAPPLTAVQRAKLRALLGGA